MNSAIFEKKDLQGEKQPEKIDRDGIVSGTGRIGQELKIEVEAVSVYGKEMEIRLLALVGGRAVPCGTALVTRGFSRVIVYSNFYRIFTVI